MKDIKQTERLGFRVTKRLKERFHNYINSKQDSRLTMSRVIAELVDKFLTKEGF